MMTTYSTERGSTTTVVLAIIFVAVIGGLYWYGTRSTGEPRAEVQESTSPSPTASADAMGDDVMDGDSETMSHASVQEYTQSAYDAAVASGPVVLYYFANWCPICAVEFPKFQSAVSTFDASEATFFRVNYNDSDTTDDEESSAREHQVGYQHTVVIVVDGQQVYKSQSTADYATQIGQYIR